MGKQHLMPIYSVPPFQEYPPTKSTHQQVLRALVGALAEGSGEERAARFVVDLVAAQLHVQVRISRKIKLEYEKHVCCMLLNLDSKIKLQKHLFPFTMCVMRHFFNFALI